MKETQKESCTIAFLRDIFEVIPALIIESWSCILSTALVFNSEEIKYTRVQYFFSNLHPPYHHGTNQKSISQPESSNGAASVWVSARSDDPPWSETEGTCKKVTFIWTRQMHHLKDLFVIYFSISWMCPYGQRFSWASVLNCTVFPDAAHVWYYWRSQCALLKSFPVESFKPPEKHSTS